MYNKYDEFNKSFDYEDDPNLSLPNHFITCFDLEHLTLYRQAIDAYAVRYPQHSFDIDTSGTWNSSQNPALLCYQRGDLSEFWVIFDELKAAAKEAKA